MRKAVRASVLILLLTCPAHAGHIPYGVTEPPPPPSTVPTQEGQTADGYIPYGATESLTETLLSVLESLRALF